MNNHWDLYQGYCSVCRTFDDYSAFTIYSIPCYCKTFPEEHRVMRRICHKCRIELMKIAEKTSFTWDFREHYRLLSIAASPPSLRQDFAKSVKGVK